MKETPTTTLTQRRSQITVDGAKKIQKERLTTTDISNGAVPASDERGSVMRIVIWILVMVFIGVGAALLITNLAKEDTNPNADSNNDNTPESFPVVEEEPTEEEPVEEEPVEEEPVEEVPAEEDPVTTPNSTGGDITQFSDTDRQRSASAGNTIILNNFKFYAENGVFNYIFYNVTTTEGGIDPAAKLYYEGDDLTFEISNLYRDNVTGQNNTTSRTIYGLPAITGTETQNQGNISKYKFLMSSKLKSKMTVDTEKREIRVEIQLP